MLVLDEGGGAPAPQAREPHAALLELARLAASERPELSAWFESEARPSLALTPTPPGAPR
mgnify:CR=1 FL=1